MSNNRKAIGPDYRVVHNERPTYTEYHSRYHQQNRRRVYHAKGTVHSTMGGPMKKPPLHSSRQYVVMMDVMVDKFTSYFYMLPSAHIKLSEECMQGVFPEKCVLPILVLMYIGYNILYYCCFSFVLMFLLGANYCCEEGHQKQIEGDHSDAGSDAGHENHPDSGNDQNNSPDYEEYEDYEEYCKRYGDETPDYTPVFPTN